MKKILFLILTIYLYASSLNWYSDYKKAFLIAKKENKMVMIDISKHDCPPCDFMKEVVFSGKDVQDILKKDFVLVEYYAENIPNKFRKHYFDFTPAILFYTKDGKFIRGIYGATPYEKFLKDLKNICKGK